MAQIEKMFKGSITLTQARKAGLRFYDGLMLNRVFMRQDYFAEKSFTFALSR